MATYYCDLAAAYVHGNTGASGSPWNGAVGFQRALDTIPYNSTIWVEGEADLRKLQVITYNNLAGGVFAAGDTVTESGAALWAATVYTDNGATQMVVEVTAGVPVNGQTFDNGAGVSADVNGVPGRPGIVTKINGTSANTVRIQGTDDITSVDLDELGLAYLATLNANSDALIPQCVLWGHDHHVIANLVGKGSVGNGFTFSGATYCVVKWCISELNATNGFYGMSTSIISHCIARNNTEHGFYTSNGVRLSLCLSHGNTNSDGIYSNDYGAVYGCLCYDNGGKGIACDRYTAVFNCVCDDNAGGGIRPDAAYTTAVIGCRGTNNIGDGFTTGAGNDYFDYCVAHGNSVAGWDPSVQRIEPTCNAAPVDDGYVNAGLRDYNLKGGAEISGEAADSEIDLNWDP